MKRLSVPAYPSWTWLPLGFGLVSFFVYFLSAQIIIDFNGIYIIGWFAASFCIIQIFASLTAALLKHSFYIFCEGFIASTILLIFILLTGKPAT
jgi:hypothetical protein